MNRENLILLCLFCYDIESIFCLCSLGQLWRHLDATVQMSRQSHSATADAIVEVQHYLREPHINRNDDPLQYWETQKLLFSHLYNFVIEMFVYPCILCAL